MAALATAGTPTSVEIAGRVLPFTSFEDIARSIRSGLDRAGLRPCDDRPPCFVLDEAGRRIAKVASRRTFAVGEDGFVDYSRCLFDFGLDEGDDGDEF